jgi:hypothetical protein
MIVKRSGKSRSLSLRAATAAKQSPNINRTRNFNQWINEICADGKTRLLRPGSYSGKATFAWTKPGLRRIGGNKPLSLPSRSGGRLAMTLINYPWQFVVASITPNRKSEDFPDVTGFCKKLC